MNHDNEDVRNYAASALEEVGGCFAYNVDLTEFQTLQIIDILIDSLSNENVSMRTSVTKVLMKNFIERLKDFNRNNKESAREAAKALGRMGSDKAVDALIQALYNSDTDVETYQAYYVLGEIGSKKAVPDLIQALHQQKVDTRMLAGEALWNIAETNSYPCFYYATLPQKEADWILDKTQKLANLVSSADLQGINKISWDTYKNLDLSYDNGSNSDLVGLFIQRWFHFNPEWAVSLRQALDEEEKERIRDLVRNPFHLSLLCAVWHGNKANLPETKAELYTQYVEQVSQRNRNVVPLINQQRLIQKLGELSLQALLDTQQSQFYLSNYLVNYILGDELKSQALQLGWLNQTDITPDNQPLYAFFHPNFQEYFASNAINQADFFLKHKLSSVSKGTYHIFDKKWWNVFLFWLGRNDLDNQEKENLIYRLAKFKSGFKFDFDSYRILGHLLALMGLNELEDCSLELINIIISNVCSLTSSQRRRRGRMSILL